MFGFFSKITAFIVSVLIMIFGAPTDFEPIVTGPVETENIEAISNNFGISEHGEYVFDDFDDFKNYYLTINRSNEMREYAANISEDFFEKNNLVIVDVALPSTAEKTFVSSASENGDTLILQYYIKRVAEGGCCVICYDSICIKVSKNITKVNAVELVAPAT